MTMTTQPPDWVVAHRRAWDAKPGLRRFYEKEYFSRIVAALPEGRSLEVGAGPGFFADYHRPTVVTDISAAPNLDLVADVHDLPFGDGSFNAVIGIDVLHHFQNPIRALGEFGRVLAPGGRLVLIEPWTTPFSRLFHTYVHHEDCFLIPDPIRQAFPPGKNSMEGNAEIPRTYLERVGGELQARTGLVVRSTEIFGLFGYLATGGFSRLYFGEWITNAMIGVDRLTPSFLRKLISLKAFVVAEKEGRPTGLSSR